MRAMRMQALASALMIASFGVLLLLSPSVAAADGIGARIQIAVDGVSEVGSTQTLTVTVDANDGSGYAPAAGVTVTPSLGAGSVGTVVGGTCVGSVTDSDGQCTVMVTSAVAGYSLVGASASLLTADGAMTTVTTDGTGENSGPAVRTWVDARIALTPTFATNEVRDPQLLIAAVRVNDGSGWAPAPDGSQVAFSLVSGPGYLESATCETVGGSCVTTLNANDPGRSTVRAATMVMVGGLTLDRTTGGCAPCGTSPDARTTWVDATISLTPSFAVNEVRDSHTLTATVMVHGGYMWGAAPLGTVVNFAITGGPGSLSASSCTTASGSCSVTLTSAVAGLTTVSASSAPKVGLLTLQRTTDGLHGNSGPATKQWVDARIAITPATGMNPVGEPHPLTASVSVDDGRGWAPAPDGTVVSFTIESGPGSLDFDTCVTVGGSCSVSLSSTEAGLTTVSASTSLTVVGVVLSRTTDGADGNSGRATKLWIAGSVSLTKTAALGPFTAAPTVCFTIDRTDSVLLLAPSTPATQCHTFSEGDPGHIFNWSGLDSGSYTLTETVSPSPPYTAVAPISFALDAVTHPTLDLGTVHNPLGDGALRIIKRDGLGQLWTTPLLTFYLCEGDVAVCDATNQVATELVGTGNNPAEVALPEGTYTLCEVVPQGYTLQMPFGTTLSRPCVMVEVVAAQTAEITLYNVRPEGVVRGGTIGYWGNRNGNAVLDAADGESGDGKMPSVTIGVTSGRYFTTRRINRSNQILRFDGCDLFSPSACTSSSLAGGLNPQTFYNLAAQTLGLQYNIRYKADSSTGATFAGQTLAQLGAPVPAALTMANLPAALGPGLTTNSTVEEVLALANRLIAHSLSDGATTQASASAMVSLLGDYVNEEA